MPAFPDCIAPVFVIDNDVVEVLLIPKATDGAGFFSTFTVTSEVLTILSVLIALILKIVSPGLGSTANPVTSVPTPTWMLENEDPPFVDCCKIRSLGDLSVSSVASPTFHDRVVPLLEVWKKLVLAAVNS